MSVKLMRWGAGTLATVTLSGHTLENAFTSAELIVNADGNVYEDIDSAGASQIDSSTDWVRPTGAAPGEFEVRLDIDSAGSLSGDSTGAWLALTSSRSWTSTSTGTIQTTVRIRRNGSVLASAGYDFVVSP